MQRILARAEAVLHNRDLTVVLGCCLLLGLSHSFVVPFLSIFGTIEVGMTPWQFGLFMTTTAVSATIITTWLARWSDTHGCRRQMLLLGGVCGALGYVGFAWARDPVLLTLISATALAVSSVTFSQLFAYARETLARSDIPPGEAPLYMNVFRLFYALAWTVGPALAAWVMLLFSYRGTFLVAAGVFVALIVVVWRFVPPTQRTALESAAPRVPLRQVFKRPEIALTFASFALIFAASTLCMMNLPLFVLESLGGNARHVGIIFSLAPVFELPLMFYFGLLASRGSQDNILRFGAALAIVYYALLAVVGAPWHIYPLQILGAAVTAVTAGVALTYFQNHLPGQAGVATNLYASAQRIGSTSGYLLFGLLTATVGHRGVFLISTGLCVVTLALLSLLARSVSPAALKMPETVKISSSVP